MYYYRFRYYDCNTQRFLSLDPIGHSTEDFNHYRYVFNNPVNLNDALGLAASSRKCKLIERKMKHMYKKAITPLKRVAAKQVVKLL